MSEVPTFDGGREKPCELAGLFSPMKTSGEESIAMPETHVSYTVNPPSHDSSTIQKVIHEHKDLQVVMQ